MSQKIIFPIVSLIAAVLLMLQMWQGRFASSSFYFVLMLGLVVSLLGALSVVRTLREQASDPSAVSPHEALGSAGLGSVAILVLASFIAVPSMVVFGYAATFFLYSCVVGRIIYRGALWVTLVSAVAITALVHFFFVRELRLKLPTGLIW